MDDRAWAEWRDLLVSPGAAAPDAPPVVAAVIAPLRLLLRTDQAAAFGVAFGPAGPTVTFLHGTLQAVANGREAIEALVRAMPAEFGLERDGPAPGEPNQVALRHALPEQRDGTPPRAADPRARAGLAGHDLLRVLVCEREVVLACVVAYRRERFTERERHHVQRVVPLLRARLALERRLDEAPLAAAALGAALDLISAPAFVVDCAGKVLHENAAARRLLGGEPGAVEAELRAAASGRPPSGYAVTDLAPSGAPDHFLLVKRREEGFASRVAAAAAGWALTPRQRDTLALLALGKGNRHIAAALGCSERTVEEHVSACFEKAACESRLELVASFWAGAWRAGSRQPSR